MKFKKISAVILALILVFTLSACTEGNNESTLSNSSDISSSEIESVTSTVSNSTETSEKDNTNTSSAKSSTSTSSKPTSSKNSSSKPSTTTTSQKVSSENKTNNSKVSPKLYKVTDSKGNVAWLFGSIHVGKSTFYPLPDYVTNAFYGSEVLAVEFDLVAFENDMTAQTNALSALVSPKQSVKKHLIGNDALSTYEQAVEILTENQSYSPYMDYYKPALWSMFIDSLIYKKIGADSGYGIDRHLINEAKQSKIKIDNIESADAQYKMLAGFSDKQQTMMLKGSIESYKSPDSKKDLDALMNIWETGDYAKLRKMLREDYDAMYTDDPALCKEYNDAMNVKRDALMTDYVVKALSSGKRTFVCVGAAHIARENGIADSLKARGYTVEEVK